MTSHDVSWNQAAGKYINHGSISWPLHRRNMWARKHPAHYKYSCCLALCLAIVSGHYLFSSRLQPYTMPHFKVEKIENWLKKSKLLKKKNGSLDMYAELMTGDYRKKQKPRLTTVILAHICLQMTTVCGIYTSHDYSTVPREKLEPLFFLDYSANMYWWRFRLGFPKHKNSFRSVAFFGTP